MARLGWLSAILLVHYPLYSKSSHVQQQHAFPSSRRHHPNLPRASRKACRCTTCTSSFASTATTVSDVSTTCPPSEIDDRESVQDFEIPTGARCPPLQAFPTASTIIESVYDYQDNEASAGEFVGPDGRYMSPSQNPINYSFSRGQSRARTDSVSTVASDRTVVCPGANALQRNESVVSNATVDDDDDDNEDDDDDDDEDEEPATYTPPLSTTMVGLVPVQRIGPVRPNYNRNPAPEFPIVSLRDRRRYF
ncbi:hypothetical protein RSOL_155880, partial [Rhizoctonia solani AG-3 Rhs1AP]